MTKQTHPTITIPESTLPRFVAWIHLTEQLIYELYSRMGATSPDQAWYWRAPWQAWEREADIDIAADRIEQFASIDALLADVEG
jgi:hypothetical protein